MDIVELVERKRGVESIRNNLGSHNGYTMFSKYLIAFAKWWDNNLFSSLIILQKIVQPSILTWNDIWTI